MAGITISLAPGYHGQCSRCMFSDNPNDGKHKVWTPYNEEAQVRLRKVGALAKGIWSYVCDDCLRPEDTIADD
jgi:hypothetical protein